jgi:hypothetical protein
LSSIAFLKAQSDYYGSALKALEPVLYGKFETRIKPAQGDGLVSSFFTFNDSCCTHTPWNEIDIELLGRYEHVVDMNAITWGQSSHVRQHYVPFNPHQDFHIYGFEWTPDYVAWFIDGEEIYRQDEGHIQEMSYSQKIHMNIWNPVYDHWVGVWDDRILPRFSYYDYVSYASYTPGEGDIGTNQNFTHQWHDDFDSFDSTRWEKRHNHTFGGNQSTAVQENVVFQDGFMILCLTNSSETGFQDLTIPSALWARQYENTIDIRFSEELDLISSQMNSNYSIPDINILEAQLYEDNRTISLILESDEIIDFPSIGVFNIEDDHDPSNLLPWQALPLNTPDFLGDSVFINNGGSTFENFLEDQIWGPDKEYGHMGGDYNYAPDSIDIINTDEDQIYRSSLQKVASYKIRVENGFYDLVFMLSENDYDESNTRTFDIVIEDSLWINDLDVFSAVGLHNALDLSFNNIKVEDGILDIYFSSQIYPGGNSGGPFINGTKLIKVSSLFVNENIPKKFNLDQSYPNPFNPILSIPIEIHQRSDVSIIIYDINGRFINEVISQSIEMGQHQFFWNAQNKSSGVYFIQTVVNDQKYQSKVILLK